jgi:hypothetical protein
LSSVQVGHVRREGAEHSQSTQSGSIEAPSFEESLHNLVAEVIEHSIGEVSMEERHLMALSGMPEARNRISVYVSLCSKKMTLTRGSGDDSFFQSYGDLHIELCKEQKKTIKDVAHKLLLLLGISLKACQPSPSDFILFIIPLLRDDGFDFTF